MLLDKDGHIKVTDFGLAKGNMNADGRTNSFIGTMEYMCVPLPPLLLAGALFWQVQSLVVPKCSGNNLKNLKLLQQACLELAASVCQCCVGRAALHSIQLVIAVFRAPEIISGMGHGKAVDWWSVGILLYEMLCGMPPFKAKGRKQLQAQITTAKLKLPRALSAQPHPALSHLIMQAKIHQQTLSARHGCLAVTAGCNACPLRLGLPLHACMLSAYCELVHLSVCRVPVSQQWPAHTDPVLPVSCYL